ncbi:helix-turn-helix domain-containing protein [Streptomyces sp. 4F14]|uniref:helix-turn-helix domain-containing protein n=1 Tax=Streptomyces sp. 4F14 TaxID=3394380 RepID=UPI003A8732E8
MPAGGRPTVRSRRLGAALKRYRQAAKLDQPQAAEVIVTSQARISRFETGHATPRVIEVRLLLDAYGVADPEVRAKLEELAKNPKPKGWWTEYADQLRPDYVDYIGLENDATYIREWQQVLIPGILQTPAYMDTVFTTLPGFVSPERSAYLTEARIKRQATISEGGTRYSAVLWESLIRYPIVGPEVHREQLSALLQAGKRKNVTIQVLPFGAGAIAASHAFSAFTFDAEPVVEAVHVENLWGSSILEEPEGLVAYSDAYDLLRSTALSPEASARLIRSALRSAKEDGS